MKSKNNLSKIKQSYLYCLVVLFSFSCQNSASNNQEKPSEVVMDLVAEPIIIEEPLANDSSFQIETGVRVLAYHGADLGYLGTKHYGNKAYRNVLSAYNDFEDNRSIDMKHDSIIIPTLSDLSKSKMFPKLSAIAIEFDQVILARDQYMKLERTLWGLPKDSDNRNKRIISQATKLEVLGVSRLMSECITGLEQHANPPKKAIGQFRQVAKNLEQIAQGRIDENGYALDMVHQRMAHGLANCIRWGRER